MILLVDVDQDASTGWEGYEFMLNGNGVTKNQTPLKKYNKREGWVKVDEISYNIQGDKMMMEIPIKFINTISFDFHWVDNTEKLQNINDLSNAGDNAPSRRANYRYGN